MANDFNRPEFFIPILIRVFILIFLMFIFLFVLTWTNTLGCKAIPGWCDVFYGIKGSVTSGTISLDYNPKVAIVYSEECYLGDCGLGDPLLLQRMMMDREHFHFGVRPELLNLEFVNLGNLQKFDLVIVEHAKVMSTEKMKVFIDYVIQGGKLIWIGDSGTVLSKKEADNSDTYLLYEDELHGGDSPHEAIGPWARKLYNSPVLLSDLLGVNYKTNYCLVKHCSPNTEFVPGHLIVTDTTSPFTYGLASNLNLYAFGPVNGVGRDFAIVETIPGKVTTNVLAVNFLSDFYADPETNYGRTSPLIVITAKANIMGWEVGKNTAYYAIPPEYFAYSELPENHRYYSLLENMYYGMMYG